MLGFGGWNLADVGLFHWVLGIHRIRVDVSNPMLYDLGWLAAFGIVPLVLGWLLLRRRRGVGRGGAAAASILSIAAVVGAAVAAQPPPNSRTALVYFMPGTSLGGAVNIAVTAQAPILWMDPRGRMIAVSLADAGTIKRLYDSGALLVTRSPAIAGCGAALSI